MGKDEKGISMADLAGSLVEVRIVQPTVTEKKGNTYLLIDAKLKDKDVKFGIIGQSRIEGLLKNHGRKDDDSLFLMVPEKILQPTDDGKIQWINFDY